MLVLSRKRDERITIGDNIVIMVVDICGDKVRLGIDAPKNIPIHRQEVYDAINRENQIREEQSGLEKEAEKVPSSDSSGSTSAKQYSMVPPAMVNSSYDIVDMGRFGTHYIPAVR